VGYAAQPGEVVDRVAALTREGALAVKGNHDEAVDPSSSPGYMNESARAAIEWTRGVLTPAQKTWLARLPLCLRDDDCCLVHGSANCPERFDYVDGPTAAWRAVEAADRPYTFCGHVHDQVLYFERAPGKMGSLRPTAGTAIPIGRHRRWIAIVGSVGQPRDANPDAAYALLTRRARRSSSIASHTTSCRRKRKSANQDCRRSSPIGYGGACDHAHHGGNASWTVRGRRAGP
jgi:hypothetical protein